ncbi:MAG TPA: GNAT family N-acetyltransferase, partial [Thermoanaerobaculia bacterium]|nr:GNAT family N-acetyltransferase [Thermoanaerobaculia bacterium]
VAASWRLGAAAAAAHAEALQGSTEDRQGRESLSRRSDAWQQLEAAFAAGALQYFVWVARRDSFHVREYRSGDEQQILPIFEGSFFVPRSRERWSWEYEQNPYGNRFISLAFAANDQLVAHYAGYPVRFRSPRHREPLLALQVGDTMTLPSVRHVGRGPTSLLGRTVRHFYARFCAHRVAWNYGFNTGNIQRFSMAFVGARRLEDLPFHRLELPARTLQPPGVLRRLAGWRCERTEELDGRWDALFEEVAPQYGLLVERDARYLGWRYRRCPDGAHVLVSCFRRGRLTGWGVFRRREDRLQWGDGLFDPRQPAAVGLVLAHALALPEHRGVRTVETWACARPAWWRPLVTALGFAPHPEPNGLGLVFVPFMVDPAEEMAAALHYSMGDSDLF